MAVVKVIELICDGKTIEEAVDNGVAEAAKTIKNIMHVDVKHFHAKVENNKVVSYRVIAKISFLIEK